LGIARKSLVYKNSLRIIGASWRIIAIGIKDRKLFVWEIWAAASSVGGRVKLIVFV
jgi:hypothetical protein